MKVFISGQFCHSPLDGAGTMTPASRSHDQFSAKFGLSRLVQMVCGNLSVRNGSVLKKTDGCWMCGV